MTNANNNMMSKLLKRKCNLVACMYTLLLLMPIAIQAQYRDMTSPWYIGVKGEVPFGFSTFSSFGADKTRCGWEVGLLGGYRINSIFSTEFSASLGEMQMGTRSCCDLYWLGIDGKRYMAPVSDMESYRFDDFHSEVQFQEVGLHLNVDLLQLFRRNDRTRWLLFLSPAIYGINTKARLKINGTGQEFLKKGDQYHFAAGGDISATYRVTPNLGLRINSGVVGVAGKRIDGLPKHQHTNLIWKNGLSITWNFGRKKVSNISSQSTDCISCYSERVKTIPLRPIVMVIKNEDIPLSSTSNKGTELAVGDEVMMQKLLLPIVYFSFNSIWIEYDERSKIREIVQFLRENPTMNIHIKGWADPIGSEEVNLRVSLNRSKAVKEALIKRGIDASRITIEGLGIDASCPAKEARRTEIFEKKGGLQ